MTLSHSLVPLTFFMMLLVQAMSNGIDLNWYDAHATFYGDASGAATMRKFPFFLPCYFLMTHKSQLDRSDDS